MREHIKKSYYSKVLKINFLLICPIAVLAPLGSWVPIVLSSLLLSFFSKKFFKDLKVQGVYLYIILGFLWIVFSILFLTRDIFLLQEVTGIFVLLFLALIFNWSILNTPQFNKIIILLSISFIFSSLLIILDFQFEIGIKLWLSKNFDFNNFESFYKLKSWNNLSDFRVNNYNLIKSYLEGSYDRGITILIILSLPITIICYLYNYKFLALIVLLKSIVLLIFFSTFTIKLGVLFSFILTLFFYFKYKLFKKYFLFFLGLYFLICPFVFGIFDYKEYSNYEKKLLSYNNNIANRYCEKVSNLVAVEHLFYFNNKINFNCKYKEKGGNKTLFIKNGTAFDQEKKIKKIKTYLFYNINNTIIQKFHRLVIWSYAKEKILEKPLLGHGFLSSRDINSKMRITENKTNYQLIPLHVHNSIFEVWLELGLIGIIIFFLFFKSLFNKIYKFNIYNHKLSTLIVMSFFLVFFIAQSSFSIWQAWWLSVILLSFTLNNFIINYVKINYEQS